VKTEGVGAVNTKEEDRLALLRCIIRVDEPKILSRLRSRHGGKTRKSSQKSPMIQLGEALEERSINPHRELSTAQLNGLRERAKQLESMLLCLESHTRSDAEHTEFSEQLLTIVETVEAFASCSSEMLVAALRSSPTMDPTTKEYLPRTLGKLARYSLASRYLVKIARDSTYTIFSKIKVEIVHIRPSTEHLPVGPFLTLEQACQNVINSHAHPRKRRMKLSLEQWLGTSYHYRASQYQTRLSQGRKDWKIHAEIQLLVFHQHYPKTPKPRIIGSSKSACYLCNLFIGLHGQFQVPRTHGRLYERWTLPDWMALREKQRARMDRVIEQLNTIVEDRILVTLAAPKLHQNHPNESVVFPMKALSTSTVDALQLPTPAATPRPGEVVDISEMAPQTVPLTGLTPIAPSISSLVSEKPAKVHDTSAGVVMIGSESSKDGIHSRSSSRIPYRLATGPACANFDQLHSSNCSSSRGLKSDEVLARNETPVTASVSHISVAEHYLTSAGQSLHRNLDENFNEVYVEIGKLHLSLTRDTLPIPSPKVGDSCWLQIRWLDQEEQEHIRSPHRVQKIVSARDMKGGETITVDRGGCLSEKDLLISCGAERLVSVKYGPGMGSALCDLDELSQRSGRRD
jgi:OTT_1508-like deaminase